MWLMVNSKFFRPEHIPAVRGYLNNLPDDRMYLLASLDLKDPVIILLLSIFVGELGIDRFVIGDTGLGVAKLLTFGGCLVWWIIDCFLIMGRTRDKNYEKLTQAFGYQQQGIIR